MLEEINTYAKNQVSKFGKYRDNLRNFDENEPRIWIFSPGFTASRSEEKKHCILCARTQDQDEILLF